MAGETLYGDASHAVVESRRGSSAVGGISSRRRVGTSVKAPRVVRLEENDGLHVTAEQPTRDSGNTVVSGTIRIKERRQNP